MRGRDPALQVPLQIILEALGSKRCRGDMYYSPFRNESTPSLHVNPSLNLWFDHGASERCGGNGILLVRKARNCSRKEARRFILSLEGRIPEPVEEGGVEYGRSRSLLEVVKVAPITSPSLSAYVRRRRITPEIASRYCREVTVHNIRTDKTYSMLGFENSHGGYVLNSASGRKLSTSSYPTIFDTSGRMSAVPSSSKVLVFEGFFDFLSYLVFLHSDVPDFDAVVLNSVSNLSIALPYISAHEVLVDYLDRDLSGRKCCETILLSTRMAWQDMTPFFEPFKDLNDYLKAFNSGRWPRGFRKER